MIIITKTSNQMLANLDESTEHGENFEMDHGYTYEDVKNWVKVCSKKSIQQLNEAGFIPCLMDDDEWLELEANQGTFMAKSNDNVVIAEIPYSGLNY